MKRQTVTRLAAAWLAAALLIDFNHSVLGQTTGGSGNSGVGLPAIRTQGDVTFITGGVGHDEAHAMRVDEVHWPLSLSFFGPTNDYLADVHVRITDANGSEVLTADSRGPYMLVRLRPGAYTIHARYKHKNETRAVKVAGDGSQKVPFTFDIQ
ncbi:carboxypeptidase regulatory-like domain-containing protein [Caballeronia sp. LjRoot34]|uniref:carboxypeptidase regulatory-like domain-containing protein n=1 Tax=Caballeronia sp. LjRoot34 TaxID=3342325 RepID=UPI003ECEFBE2